MGIRCVTAVTATALDPAFGYQLEMHGMWILESDFLCAPFCCASDPLATQYSVIFEPASVHWTMLKHIVQEYCLVYLSRSRSYPPTTEQLVDITRLAV